MRSTPSEIFARRVREVRESRPKESRSQEWLAGELMRRQGIKDLGKVESFRVMVSRTEAGRRSPTIDDLFLFAAALDVHPFDLLGNFGASAKRTAQGFLRRLDALQEELADVKREIAALELDEERRGKEEK